MRKVTEEEIKDYVAENGEFEKEHRKYSTFYCWASHAFSAQDIEVFADDEIDASDFLNVLVTMSGTWSDCDGCDWYEVSYSKVEQYEEYVPEKIIPAHTVIKKRETNWVPDWSQNECN